MEHSVRLNPTLGEDLNFLCTPNCRFEGHMTIKKGLDLLKDPTLKE